MVGIDRARDDPDLLKSGAHAHFELLDLTPHATSIELRCLRDDVGHVESLALRSGAKIGTDYGVAGQMAAIVAAVGIVVVLGFAVDAGIVEESARALGGAVCGGAVQAIRNPRGVTGLGAVADKVADPFNDLDVLGDLRDPADDVVLWSCRSKQRAGEVRDEVFGEARGHVDRLERRSKSAEPSIDLPTLALF